MTIQENSPLALDTLLAEQPPRPEPALDQNTQAALGELLRSMYGDLLKRPVPDRFLDILKRLDETPQEDRS
ncbi:MAG TPA: NepR family anti-sigma factor [Microvirga sp.]|jgi:hypothetical protein|nr:NepR family anti-sigma factor [Microvirga sp.]